MSSTIDNSSKFKRALLDGADSPSSKRMRGEKGHACYTADGMGDYLLALFDKFFQGIDENQLRASLRCCLEEFRQRDTPVAKREVINLFVLAFQGRWARGGKGCKLPFYQCLKFLYEIFPDAVVSLVELIPSVGYWKDLLLLLIELQDHPVQSVDYNPLINEVWRVYATQLMKDYKALQQARVDNTHPSLSFAGKYAPRENKAMDLSLHAVSNISKLMCFDADSKDEISCVEGDDNADDFVVVETIKESAASSPSPPPTASASASVRDSSVYYKKKYREVVSALTAALDVPEVKMCARKFGDINMAAVPSRCLAKNTRAFGNESLTGIGRRSTDPDRELCREHLIECAISKKLKGAQNYPHEYVERCLDRRARSDLDILTLNAQWDSLRESIAAMAEKEKTENLSREVVSDIDSLDVTSPASVSTSSSAPVPLSLSNIIPLSDVSGSMDGTPMSVSIALGILCSELAHESFRDLVLTFSEEARFCHLSDCKTFTEKVEKLRDAEWGGNTDFYRAMQRVADIVKSSRLKQDEIPNLLVISDMQFDEAGGASYGGGYGGRYGRCDSPSRSNFDWSVTYENIKQLFHDLGMEVHGAPLTPPTIIFWNVRADAVGFPAASTDEGVILLSGYSPSLMKFILSGTFEKEVVEDECVGEDGVLVRTTKKVSVTPHEALAKILSDSGLDPVRAALTALPSGLLDIPEGDLLLPISLMDFGKRPDPSKNKAKKKKKRKKSVGGKAKAPYVYLGRRRG